MSTQAAESERGAVFVTGGTGYIGGRLVPRLLEHGWRVRCLARSKRKLESRPWAKDDRVEVVEGDASDRPMLETAMRGCSAAYYLIHSMEAAGAGYREQDRELARCFGSAALEAGVKRVIYLGGLGEQGDALSKHLTSRREVEHVLRESGPALTVLRAAMIIGSGSASFEILRYLVERLPLMITPRWVATECQPIAVRNVLHYLVCALETQETIGGVYEIGGPDVLTYRELMRVMAQERELPRRLVLPVPVLTPRLSSLWIHLVTPLSARIARPLAEGLRNPVVCTNDEAKRVMPQQLLSVRESIAAALGRLRAGNVETSWSDAGPMPGDPDWAGGTVFVDARSIDVAAPPARTFETCCRIGGGEGYYAAGWLWRVRGIMDRLVGGPGLRRGRRDPKRIRFGDALDFWRVTAIDPDRLLELRAEMKLPGVATLTFEVDPRGEDGAMLTSRLTQTARFRPKGLLGLAYWCCVVPLHAIVFNGMLKGIARAAAKG